MDDRPPSTRPRKKRRKRVAKGAAASDRSAAGAPRRPPRPQSVPRGGVEPSYDLLAVIGRIGTDLRRRVLPSALRKADGLGRRSLETLRRLGGGVWQHREAIAAASTRALWWSALALLLVVGRDVLGGAPSSWSDAALGWSCAGLGACALVTVAARPRHVRIAGAVLGAGHGAFALLSYVTTSALS